jgi:hypothetical protein
VSPGMMAAKGPARAKLTRLGAAFWSDVRLMTTRLGALRGGGGGGWAGGRGWGWVVGGGGQGEWAGGEGGGVVAWAPPALLEGAGPHALQVADGRLELLHHGQALHGVHGCLHAGRGGAGGA